MYAFAKLSPSEFGIWLYLAMNQNNYQFEYSPQAIANTGLMCKSNASKSRQGLEKKGFIIDNKFYVRPPRFMKIKKKN